MRLLSRLVPLGCLGCLFAHEAGPVTHSFDRGVAGSGPRLVLAVEDAASGRPLAARFAVAVDGKPWQPDWIDENGIRFTSTHHAKKEFFTAVYARGTGTVTVGLPAGARQVEVTASRGFEYVPGSATGPLASDGVTLRIRLARWIDLSAEGWISVDEHLHYDRFDPASDPTWLTMLEADGLVAGHFLTLKGGMTAGLWARQFAYGSKGEATDGARLVVPGEEYRDPLMGHINLLGVNRLIEPISTGGLGTPAVPENYPPFEDVLRAGRTAGGLTGVAHGGTLSREPTALADAILGAVDFWELSNGFIYSTDTWYRLMNCGWFLPPAAGTDLPNSPFRDPWQPMLGAVRTYVHTGGRTDFENFKAAMARGRIFITGGPVITLTVNGRVPGDTLVLPRGGGKVRVRAELASPLGTRELHLVRDGRDVPVAANVTTDGAIRRQSFEHELTFEKSGWVAAWGKGGPSTAQRIDAMAHTGAVRVLVGDRPVRSPEDLAHFIELLTRQRDYYLERGRYRTDADRQRAAAGFERAIAQLRVRLAD